MRKFYDIFWTDGGGGDTKEEYYKNRDLLVEIMKKKYNITEADLNDSGIVMSKIRDINITEILNSK
jgi:hypothetical protein